jgi:hypothetical protein
MTTRVVSRVFVAILLAPVVALHAQELPRAAQQPKSQQLPRTTTGESQSATQTLIVSDAEIFASVRKYIYTYAQKSADKKFHVPFGGKEVTLDLVKIHDDQRSHLGGNKYFVCVDMKAADGAIYDVDFFLAIHPGVLSVTGTSVHKINGNPLYNWKEENGVWKKVKI